MWKKISELSEEQKERRRAYNRKYAHEHRAEINAANKRKQLADLLGYRIKQRKKCAKWRDSHREHYTTYIREYMREYRKNPEVKAKEAAYQLEYRQRPEVKIHLKAIRKKYDEKYYARPEVKIRKAAYKKGWRAGRKYERNLLKTSN